jgi:hypothetical protein
VQVHCSSQCDIAAADWAYQETTCEECTL